MSPKKLFLTIAATSALAGLIAASPASAAQTIVPVGTQPVGGNPYFFITSGLATSPVITADFGATITGSGTGFDDLFQFTIPQNGLGSGSFSTSFTNMSNELIISQILINTVSQAFTTTSSGQTLTVSGIPILANALNTIEIVGATATGNVAATYAGTATFAAAVPEPATWAMTIIGLGFIGVTLRRRRRLPAAGAQAVLA